MTQYRPSGFRLLPVGVKNLLIINGLFFLATTTMAGSLDINLFRWLAMHHPYSEYFMPHQLLTHMFMHDISSFLHLFSNMFALWMFGSVLENFWGPKRFITYYLITGFGAALLHLGVSHLEIMSLKDSVQTYLQNANPETFYEFINAHFPAKAKVEAVNIYNQWLINPSSEGLASQASEFINAYYQFQINIPTVGASGAVFGILLAFGMLFPNTMIYLFFFVPIKAKWFVIGYGAFELISGLQNNPGDNVAHWAHLGGMLFGFILIKIWRRNRINFH